MCTHVYSFWWQLRNLFKELFLCSGMTCAPQYHAAIAVVLAGALGSCSDREWSPPPVTSPLLAKTSISDWVEEQLIYYQTYGSCNISHKPTDPYGGVPPRWFMGCTLRSHLVEDTHLVDPIQSRVFRLAFEAIEGKEEDEQLRYFKMVINEHGESLSGSKKDTKEKDNKTMPIASLGCIVFWYNDPYKDPRNKLILDCEEFPEIDGMEHLHNRNIVSSHILSSLESRMKAQERKMRRQ